ncbi:MAG: MerR family transcriptional regulator [Lachnospiraceae bacterium]
MLINETSKATNLTKKAIEYYVEQRMICPRVLENGYRDFSEADICTLKKISVLRKLGVCTDNIQTVLSDKTGEVLQRLSVQQELNVQIQKIKKAALDKLSSGSSYESIATELKAIEQNATITEKLLEAFPGYYGRFVCLHFARFLNEPIIADEQQIAYEKIVLFLDSVPRLTLPKDLQEYLMEATKHISTQNISEMIASTKQSIENPEDFISNNKEILDEYLAYKQSTKYKNSPVFQIKSLLKEFNCTSGYYDVFIPMMKQLSPTYANYYAQMEIANDKLLAQYPAIANLGS